MSHIQIIFTSTGGNTELVIDQVCEVLSAKGHVTSRQRAEVCEVDALEKGDVLLFAAPTYGVGEIHYHFDQLLKAMKGFDLKGKKCGIVSLGDIKYHPEYHNEGANVLTVAIKEAKGEVVGRPMRLNGSPVGQMEKVVEWAEKWSEELGVESEKVKSEK
jgi:flavodoxin